ncbi:Hypothetical protein MCYN_0714 [Mycoplasmopsis cynos C142]|uniref:Uncharacterized protein n=1 Tax=Mycoplasmopsis cynos (strain C142) TaxID=1246955 RepID=L0RY01_MYCC1|nr:Hypothetical protein MCYN_0714 [Mycoplasmopsis cynos C142]
MIYRFINVNLKNDILILFKSSLFCLDKKPISKKCFSIYDSEKLLEKKKK